MIRLFSPYNLTILKMNIIFSFMLTFLSSLLLLALPSSHSMAYLLICLFIVWIMTGGFFLSALYYEWARGNEYYFYYNLGISKFKLILISYLFHFVFVIPFIIVLRYV
jgi:hypothetical protein